MTLLAVLAALVVGASLALSGATLQSVLRNPLAEPYILGLVGGASLGVALVYTLGLDAVCPFLVPVAAFAGSTLSLALVCLIAFFAARCTGRRALSGGVTVVAGFVTGGLTNSLQMLVLAYATPEQSGAAYKWVWGDLRAIGNGSGSWVSLGLAALACAAAFVVLFSLSRKLNALVLGEDAARSLGVSVRGTQLLALGAASLATASSVALVGAVGFLGLVVPHVVRRVFGGNHRVYLPVSAAGGALFLLAANGLAGLFPGDLPVGVVCALVGAPFFLCLLVWRGRA